MKKQFQGILIGFLLYMLIFGGATFAANLQKDIDVTYRDIKLQVDENLITPRDAAGNIVEPFIYDGTTYLPVRAVSEALDRDVDWDGETSTVHINKKQLKKVYLYDMNLDKNPSEKYFYKKESNSVKYLGFAPPYTGQGINTNILPTFTDMLIYSLNGTAEEIAGTALPPTVKEASYSVVFSDENDKELYTLSMNVNSKATDFKFNAKNVKTLKIEFICRNTNYTETPVCAIRDLAILTYEK